MGFFSYKNNIIKFVFDSLKSLSVTVSAQNEVIKDLITRLEALEYLNVDNEL